MREGFPGKFSVARIRLTTGGFYLGHLDAGPGGELAPKLGLQLRVADV